MTFKAESSISRPWVRVEGVVQGPRGKTSWPFPGTPGMRPFLEVKVLYGPGNRNRFAEARASPRGGV